jgi:hypothetical protein
MLFEEVIVVYIEKHKKSTNSHFGQNTELTVKADDTYSYYWTLKMLKSEHSSFDA